MSNNTIAALILTKDEEKHIARCIRSLQGVCDEILVIDSFSTDRTCEIAESLGAKCIRTRGRTMRRSSISCVPMPYSKRMDMAY